MDKNCAAADVETYKCQTPIDAAFYIGITFDMTKVGSRIFKISYSSITSQFKVIENGVIETANAFRGKLVKQWCREMNVFQGSFDIPDGMHAQGLV